MRSIDFPITSDERQHFRRERSSYSQRYFKQVSLNPKILLIFLLNAGKIKNPEPSTIIDLTTQAPKIVRIGVVGKEKMLDIFKKFI